MKSQIYIMVILAAALTACGSSDSAPIATATQPPTSQPQPTNTPAPTATLAPSPTPDPIISLDNANAIMQLAEFENRPIYWAPIGHSFAIFDLDQISIWEAGQSAAVQTINITAAVSPMLWSPNGQLIATRSDDEPYVVSLWDISNGEQTAIFEGFTRWISSTAFSPDSKYFAAADSNGNLFLWAVASGELIAESQGHAHHVAELSWSPDGSLLTTVNSGIWSSRQSVIGTTYLRTGTNGEVIYLLDQPAGFVEQMAWSADSSILTTEVHGFGTDNSRTIKLWDTSSGKLIAALKGQFGAKWATEGHYLVTSDRDETITLWDGESGDELAVFEASIAVWSPDGLTLATAGIDDNIRLWDGTSGEALLILQGNEVVSSLAWSPDGRVLVSGDNDGQLTLWDPASGDAIITLEGISGFIYRISWVVDGQVFSSVSYDRETETSTVYLWGMP